LTPLVSEKDFGVLYWGGCTEFDRVFLHFKRRTYFWGLNLWIFNDLMSFVNRQATGAISSAFNNGNTAATGLLS